MKGFTSLAHVAIKVKDLDRSLDFYVNKLGFPEMMRLNHRDGRSSGWSICGSPTTSISRSSPRRSATERAGRDANGVNHICLAVDDIDAVVARAQKPRAFR